MKKKIIFSFLVFIGILFSINIFLQNNYSVPILMYHSIDSSRAKTSGLAVSVERFNQQMEFLAKNNYNCISLKELITSYKDNARLPRNSVVITFDDGYKDNFSKAYPVLEKYGLKATIFIAVNHVGKIVNDEYFKEAKFMSWQDLRTLDEGKLVEIGSHTLSHSYLPDLDTKDLKEEIFISKDILEKNLKRPIEILSFPIGGFNKMIKDMVKSAGYLGACSTNRGYNKNYKHTDMFELKRIKISNKDNALKFRFKISGFYTLFKKPKDPE